jgi:hypothetical protein
MTQENMQANAERQEYILKWNETATAAQTLTDDVLFERIEALKRTIRLLRVEKEALDTEADSRGKKRAETQKLIDNKYTSPIVDAQRRKEEGKAVGKVDKAIQTLMNTMGLTEAAAREKLGNMYQKTAELKKG